MGSSWHKCRITPRIQGVKKDPVIEEDPKADHNLGMPRSTYFPFLSYIYEIWKKMLGYNEQQGVNRKEGEKGKQI